MAIAVALGRSGRQFVSLDLRFGQRNALDVGRHTAEFFAHFLEAALDRLRNQNTGRIVIAELINNGSLAMLRGAPDCLRRAVQEGQR